MKKLIFAVFAHPDDEAFGPCGTLLREVKSGSDVHILLLTTGENGTNPDSIPDLGATRYDEWHHSVEALGVTSARLLSGYTDGQLCNNNHLQIAKQIETLIKQTVDAYPDDVEIELLSLDLSGITGHIDHIVASRSACLAFYRLKKAGFPMLQIRLYCLPFHKLKHENTDFCFMQPGRIPEEIGETIDNSSYHDEIIAVMKCHHSQRKDMNSIIALMGNDIAIDRFVILK